MASFVNSDIGTVPATIGEHFPNLAHEEHLPKRNPSFSTTIDSILNDHTFTVLNAAKNIVYGVTYAVSIKTVMILFSAGEKRIFANRLKNKNTYFLFYG